MHTNRLHQLIPSGLEITGLGFATIFIIVAGNGHYILNRLGLSDSSQFVHQQLAQQVTGGLHRLDSFSITTSAISFMVWAIIGLAAFSVVQTIVRFSAEFSNRRQLSSNAYVHPAGFQRESFWRAVFSHVAISFALLLLLSLVVLAYSLLIVPVGFSYIRPFLLTTNWLNSGQLCLGTALIFIASTVVYVFSKLVFRYLRP